MLFDDQINIDDRAVLMSYNKVMLKGTLYLVNSDKIEKLSGKPYIDCKLIAGEAPSLLLDQHDVLLVGFQAVKALGYIRANNDEPVMVLFEGKLLCRNGISIPRAKETEYLVSAEVAQKAEEIIGRLTKGDSFLEASFQKTAEQHSFQLQTICSDDVPVNQTVTYS